MTERQVRGRRSKKERREARAKRRELRAMLQEAPPTQEEIERERCKVKDWWAPRKGQRHP